LADTSPCRAHLCPHNGSVTPSSTLTHRRDATLSQQRRRTKTTTECDSAGRPTSALRRSSSWLAAPPPSHPPTRTAPRHLRQNTHGVCERLSALHGPAVCFSSQSFHPKLSHTACVWSDWGSDCSDSTPQRKPKRDSAGAPWPMGRKRTAALSPSPPGWPTPRSVPPRHAAGLLAKSSPPTPVNSMG
jgi:hypothetical protein